jgi:hypothetical protein
LVGGMEQLRPRCCLVEEQEDRVAPGEEYSLRFWDELALKKVSNTLVLELHAHAVFWRRAVTLQVFSP